MKAINDNGTIIQRPTIPISWGQTDGYNLLPTEDHYDDGWRDVAIPSYNTTTEKLGQIYFDDQNDVFTYPVVARTEEEIQRTVLSQMEQDKQMRLQILAENQIVESMQLVEDDETLLENASIFPLWDVAMDLLVDQKIQAWDGVELKLYRVVQGHTTQAGWEPPTTPALFTRVGYAGEILDWVQPTGAQDAYQVGDKVKHNDKTWESTAANNTWEPGVYGWVEI